MSVFRSLFWFALVALLFPRGPDLGLEFPGHIDVPAIHLPWSGLSDVGRLVAADPIEAYRTAVFDRLAMVRMELAADRAQRGMRGRFAVLLPPPIRD